MAGSGLAARSVSAQQTHLLVVSGIGGMPEYSEAFYREGAALVDAARKKYGLADSSVVFLAERPERDPARIRARSTAENVDRAIAGIARRAHAGDQVLVVLIGHGSDAGGAPRLNLPGPDLGAAQLASMLDRLSEESVAVVNTTASSGGFITALKGKNRLVITATRNAAEANETVFGRHFVDALTGDGADADKDGRVSLLEAYLYARREVARAYAQENELQTEHALLDGDGDGTPSADSVPSGPDARGAARFVLAESAAAAGVPAAVAGDPAVKALLERKRTLQGQIDSLKAAKAGMEAGAYQDALETLLLELARIDAELRKGGKAP